MALVILILLVTIMAALKVNNNFKPFAIYLLDNLLPFKTSTNGLAGIDLETSNPRHLLKHTCPAGTR
jgi:hypothetical protein